MPPYRPSLHSHRWVDFTGWFWFFGSLSKHFLRKAVKFSWPEWMSALQLSANHRFKFGFFRLNVQFNVVTTLFVLWLGFWHKVHVVRVKGNHWVKRKTWCKIPSVDATNTAGNCSKHGHQKEEVMHFVPQSVYTRLWHLFQVFDWQGRAKVIGQETQFTNLRVTTNPMFTLSAMCQHHDVNSGTNISWLSEMLFWCHRGTRMNFPSRKPFVH